MKVLSLMVFALSLCLAPSLASAGDGKGGYDFYSKDKSSTFLCGGQKCKVMNYSYVKSRDLKKGYKADYDSDKGKDVSKDKDYGKDVSKDKDYGKDVGKDKDYGKDTGKDKGYDKDKDYDKDKGGMDVDNGKPTVIPEINAGGTSMALVLISGLLMVLRERRRRGMKA